MFFKVFSKTNFNPFLSCYYYMPMYTGNHKSLKKVSDFHNFSFLTKQSSYRFDSSATHRFQNVFLILNFPPNLKKNSIFKFLFSSEFQEACALAQSDRISTFATQDCINEYMTNQGIYPCHLCCQNSSIVSFSFG